jgi:hypothetical protein
MIVPLVPILERARTSVSWRTAVAVVACAGFVLALIGATSFGTWWDRRDPFALDNSPLVIFVQGR